MDLALESGEYFLSQEQKAARRNAEIEAAQAEGVERSQAQRQQRYVAPKEVKPPLGAAASTSNGGAVGGAVAGGSGSERDAAAIAAALKAKAKSPKAGVPRSVEQAEVSAIAEARKAERARLLPTAKLTKKAKKAKE